ncbi:hypothetical protein LINPERPRIM_LOCUS28460 [Linum perenne]
MGMMALTPLKVFLMLFQLSLLNLLLRINWHIIHCGQSLTSFMVMGMSCSLYVVITRGDL